MDREILNSEFQALERRLKLLLNEHKALKEEIQFLKDENTQLKVSVKTKDDHLNNFQNKIKISKLVGSMAVEHEDTAELKQMINNYIKEIDKCIAHLSE